MEIFEKTSAGKDLRSHVKNGNAVAACLHTPGSLIKPTCPLPRSTHLCLQHKTTDDEDGAAADSHVCVGGKEYRPPKYYVYNQQIPVEEGDVLEFKAGGVPGP